MKGLSAYSVVKEILRFTQNGNKRCHSSPVTVYGVSSIWNPDALPVLEGIVLLDFVLNTE
jgi:hypothetical protein